MTKVNRQKDLKDASDVIADIEDIVSDLRNGQAVILVDDEDRENEGDLVIAAQMATPENINFMAKYGRGLICLPMEQKMIDRLGLELMGRGDNTIHRTAFTVSIEAKEGVTTGISAADRAKTIQTAIHPDTLARDIATPGHVFPLAAKEGGVLVRAGHTEAAVDLSKMAGFSGAGVICEIMNDDGSMARLPDLADFARTHGLKIGTIADLIAYRTKNEKLVECIHEQDFKSRYGSAFKMRLYSPFQNDIEHIALIKGDIKQTDEPVLVRMHALNVLNDALGGGDDNALEAAMKRIDENGSGVIVIIRETDPCFLSKHLQGSETGESQIKRRGNNQGKALRNYGVGAQILKDLGVKKMLLLTNTPKTVVGLDGYGLEITGHQSF